MTVESISKSCMNVLAEKYFLLFIFIFTPLFFFCSTLIFNDFWSGEIFPQLATNPKDQREYMTAYISLLGFLGTVEGVFLVILSYNDWKKQHKKITVSNDAKTCLAKLFELSNKLRKITVLKYKLEVTEELKKELNEKFEPFELLMDQTLSDFIILSAMSKHDYLKDDFTSLYQDYLILISGLKKVVNENLTDIDLKYYWDLESQCNTKNDELRPFLMYYIELYS